MDDTDFTIVEWFEHYKLTVPNTQIEPTSTKIEKRDLIPDTPKKCSKPIDKLDEATYDHDLWYGNHKDSKSRYLADMKLAKAAAKVASDLNATDDERRAANLVAILMHGKVLVGSVDLYHRGKPMLTSHIICNTEFMDRKIKRIKKIIYQEINIPGLPQPAK